MADQRTMVFTDTATVTRTQLVHIQYASSGNRTRNPRVRALSSAWPQNENKF